MINRVVRALIGSDVTLFFSIGLLSPIFAVFITGNIENGTLEVVGLAAAVYWLARSVFSIPISKLMDSIPGEKDEYYFMVVGSYIMTFVPLFYIVSNQPWHIYILGIINGMAASMAVPGWRIMFTNHLDRGATGYEWSVEDVGVGIAIAISSYVGAFLAENFGFNVLFIIITIVGVIGVSVFLVPLYRQAHIIGRLRKQSRYTNKDLR